jgi:hypothetical protein
MDHLLATASATLRIYSLVLTKHPLHRHNSTSHYLLASNADLVSLLEQELIDTVLTRTALEINQEPSSCFAPGYVFFACLADASTVDFRSGVSRNFLVAVLRPGGGYLGNI